MRRHQRRQAISSIKLIRQPLTVSHAQRFDEQTINPLALPTLPQSIDYRGSDRSLSAQDSEFPRTNAGTCTLALLACLASERLSPFAAKLRRYKVAETRRRP